MGYGNKVLLREDNITWSPEGAYGYKLPKHGELILTDASIVFLWDQKGIRSETKGVCIPLQAIPIVGGDAAISVVVEPVGDNEFEHFLRVHSGTALHYFRFDGNRHRPIGKWVDSVNELLTGNGRESSSDGFRLLGFGKLGRIVVKKARDAVGTNPQKQSTAIDPGDNPRSSFIPSLVPEGDTFRTGDASNVGNQPRTPSQVDLGVAARQIEGLHTQGILTEEEYVTLLQRVRDAIWQ